MLIQLGAGLVDDRVERLGVEDRQLGEALAIEGDPGQVQAVDQSAVAEPAHLGGGAQAGDEQLAEAPLLGPAVAEGEHPGAEQGLLRRLEEPPASADEPFHLLEQPLLRPVAGRALLRAHGRRLSIGSGRSCSVGD